MSLLNTLLYTIIQGVFELTSIQGVLQYTLVQSPKFKRVSLDKTPEFPFWELNICVDFDLRDSKKIENMNKLNKIIFNNKNIDFLQNYLTPFVKPGL